MATTKRRRGKAAEAERRAKVEAIFGQLKDTLHSFVRTTVDRCLTELQEAGATSEDLEWAREELPPLPPVDERGRYPAIEAMRATLARGIIISRRKLGWTQAELAKRAGISRESLSRIESGKVSPNIRTVDRIEAALKAGGGS